MGWWLQHIDKSQPWAQTPHYFHIYKELQTHQVEIHLIWSYPPLNSGLLWSPFTTLTRWNSTSMLFNLPSSPTRDRPLWVPSGKRICRTNENPNWGVIESPNHGNCVDNLKVRNHNFKQHRMARHTSRGFEFYFILFLDLKLDCVRSHLQKSKTARVGWDMRSPYNLSFPDCSMAFASTPLHYNNCNKFKRW